MKLLTIFFISIILTILTPIARAQSKNTSALLQILPINCVFNIIDDGMNTIVYITPDKCNIPNITPTPSPSTLVEPHPIVYSPPKYINQPQALDNSQPTKNNITLGRCSEYYSQTGIKINLSLNQIIGFSVIRSGIAEEHTITLTDVGRDNVVVTIASTPMSHKLYIGEKQLFDVNLDGTNDIEITLNNITNDYAELTLKQCLTKPQTLGKTEVTNTKRHINNYIVFTLLAISFVGSLFIILAKRRRANNQ